MLEVKHALIIGGTGTLGSALIDNIHKKFPHVKITIASRNEHKHAEIRNKKPWIRTLLCDIRDKSSLKLAMQNMDVVFHVAALKHVDLLEDNPQESIKTNIIGTINVAESCIENKVKYCVFCSTDKAVLPINTYGYSKALSEKVLHDLNNKQIVTRFSIFRWGNILFSQGSAIPFFVDCLRSGRSVPLTSEEMTRYWLKIDDAANFMIDNYSTISNEALLPPNMKAAPILLIISALADLLDVEPRHTIVGLRKGEKLHEDMFFDNDIHLNSKKAPQYSFSEIKELLRPMVQK